MNSPLRSLLLYGIGFLILCGAGWEVWSLWHRRGAELHATSQALAATEARGPVVRVMSVKQGPTERKITLLGDARSYVMQRCTANSAAIWRRYRLIAATS